MKSQENQINCIKVDPRFKGLHHFEDYLIKKHRRELIHFMFEKDLKPKLQSSILLLYSKRITRENIIGIYTHPPIEFLHALIDNTLGLLAQHTSVTNIPQTKTSLQ